MFGCKYIRCMAGLYLKLTTSVQYKIKSKLSKTNKVKYFVFKFVKTTGCTIWAKKQLLLALDCKDDHLSTGLCGLIVSKNSTQNIIFKCF